MKKLFALLAVAFLCTAAVSQEKEPVVIQEESEAAVTYVGFYMTYKFQGMQTLITVHATERLATRVNFTLSTGQTATILANQSSSDPVYTNQAGGRVRIEGVSPVSYGDQNYSYAVGVDVEF